VGFSRAAPWGTTRIDGASGPLASQHQGHTSVRVKTPDTAVAQTVLARLGLLPDGGLREPHSEDVSWVSASVEPHSTTTATHPDLIVSELVAAGVRIHGFSVEASGFDQNSS